MATPMVARAVDTRNLEWKNSNVGAKLLGKMGWKDGQGIGKRQRITTTAVDTTTGATSTATTTTGGATNGKTAMYSSEGLRIVRRQDGLGIGATVLPGNLAGYGCGSAAPVQSLSSILTQLQSEHHVGNSNSRKDKKDKKKKDKKKKKKDKKEKDEKPSSLKVLALPTNKTTHHKVRAAKFQAKTSDDMKCIFGGIIDYAPAVAPSATTSTPASTSTAAAAVDKNTAKKDKESKKKRKDSKKDKTDKKRKDESPNDESPKKKKKSRNE